MQGISIFVPQEILPESFAKAIEGRWTYFVESPGDLLVEEGPKHLFVLCYELLQGQSEWNPYHEFDEQRDRILSVIPQPRVIAVEFNDIDLLKQFVIVVADRNDFLILTDQGDFMAGSDFAERIRAKHGWDWRW